MHGMFSLSLSGKVRSQGIHNSVPKVHTTWSTEFISNNSWLYKTNLTGNKHFNLHEKVY